MRKFLPAFVCFCLALILVPSSIGSTTSKINTYPNLPAPIAKERILITSAGQAVEGAIMQSIAENLNLEADYRPRALDTDLYEYKSVVIVVGYSKNGLAQTVRNFQEELSRSKHLVQEAEANGISVIVVDFSGSLRNDSTTWKLLEEVIPHCTYYIGFSHTKKMDKLHAIVKEHHIPITLIDQIMDIEVPFNSAYR
ncbi:DUF6305 family protein [Ornithinibacillus bavariensis]|uniref:DUF6305 family protein n=1 Tax=Ornithinibacillus bavariensis TaxID=545502 RepID=UPI003D1EA72C